MSTSVRDMAGLDPLHELVTAFERAQRGATHDATAAALATADAQGRPAVRYVLVKEVTAAGVAFFTNRTSPKAQHLEVNPWASLAFYWPWVGEQVRVLGPTSAVAEAEADAYFKTRPRGSQIGAWASRQSAPIASRAELEAAYAAVEREYEGRDVPRPPHWGGYRIVPTAIEFWYQGDFRLHDRWLFSRADASSAWECTRLNP